MVWAIQPYPDNLIENFVENLGKMVLIFLEFFDSLNWVKAMEPSIKYVRNKTEGIAEAAAELYRRYFRY